MHVYTPIVKGKLNDLKALGALPPATRALMRPLVEVMPAASTDDVEEHLEKFSNYLRKHAAWPRISVDFYGVAGLVTSSGVDATLAGFAKLKERQLVVTPVYGFQRDDRVWAHLNRVVKYFGSGFGFRVDIDDLDDQAEETWGSILERSAQLTQAPSDVDIIIDLRDLGPQSVDAARELVVDFLSIGPRGGRYRSVSVVGSSALKNVGDITRDAMSVIRRKELHLWTALERDLPESESVVFGDYGVVHPEFTDQGSFANMNAKIRYTVGGRILYFRGHMLRGDYEQYRALAAQVRGSGEYLGPKFSYGDQYIDDVADLGQCPVLS